MVKGTVNPADVQRRLERKEHLKKSKKKVEAVKEMKSMMENPDRIEEEIQKAQALSDATKLDKGLKEKVRELQQMKAVALKRQKERAELGIVSKAAPATSEPTSSSSTGANTTPAPPRTAPPAQRGLPQQHKPEDSVYYHPQFNPSGAPPAGRPWMYVDMGYVQGAIPLSCCCHIPYLVVH